jgi:flagellar protein FliL
MKKIILLFIVLLVVMAGAGAAYFFFFKKKADAGHENQAHQEEPKKKPDGPPAFVQVGPMTIPVIGPKKIEQNLTIIVSLQMDDEATREKVNQQKFRLLDAYIQALYGAVDAGQILEGQAVNIPAIKGKLMETTEKVLGPHVVRDILIQSVSQRPVY